MPAELAATIAATDDDRLMQAEAIVRSFCGWHIAPVRTEVATFTAYEDSLILPTLRLVDVVRIVDCDGVIIDPAHYTAESYGVVRRAPRGYFPANVSRFTTEWSWAQRWGDLTVTFRHGYETPPFDVSGVVRGLALRIKNNPTGLDMQTRGPFSEKYSTDLFATEREILNRYRLPARP